METEIEPLLRRVRGEYLEMPGLRLTRAQARRLWGVDERLVEVVLALLVESRFLTATHDGAFARPSVAG